MALEIELKLKVDDFGPIKEKLKQLGAEFEGDFFQADAYYDDCEDSLINSDRCLRIRKHKNHLGEAIELTYKGARENHRFKSRREIGLKVEKAEELAELFQELGYKEKLTFEKKRGLWEFGGCKVALDELPMLGKFVEIEGPNDNMIERAQKELGLGNLKHTPQSYAHLMEEAIAKTGSKKRRISFDLK
ncbi:MAG: class IV adenylate cyclase [Planctomycetes bacterium]|nr:class IV adenylate cyclase [Planctomycetota bacterium]MBU1518179.1 class IV adenylate cyclase [Planctomycetota bacterium]MBU2457173.1 class IV adenylate cyclase [Planctomycetota bacterium]